MPQIKRRQFLQFAGSTLATLGFSQLDIQRQGDRYAQVLAQSTPRKLALLVGINAYSPAQSWSPLQGCVTDVRLQEELLVHRFGFNPNDILTLTDNKATRAGILRAFEEHLIKQVKPGDVVVFHYSGHGSRVSDPDRDFADGLNSTFVPIDSPLPPEYQSQGGVVQDITGHTLFLLMSALPTENVTVVLDSCHSGGGKRGNLTVRSRDGGAKLQPSPAELEYQQQWRSRLKLSPEEFKQRRQANIAKGVVIASAKRNQYAADVPFGDFHAGAFTYLLTRYFWQQVGNDSVGSVIANISRSTQIMARDFSKIIQEPEVESNLPEDKNNQPIYFVNRPTPPAEAVVLKADGDQAEFWLGGVDFRSLEAFEKDALFTVLNRQGHEQGLVRLESRAGLVGRGKFLEEARTGTLSKGAFLQERIRGVPQAPTLRIGLGNSLGNDTAATKQALQAIPRLVALPLGQGTVDYILDRMTQSYQKNQSQQTTDLPAIGTIGLFSPGQDVISNSFGPAEETASDAVRRLQGKFKSLLAIRLVKMTLNPGSSQLNVVAAMHPVGSQLQATATEIEVRGGRGVSWEEAADDTPTVIPETARRLPIGSQVQFQIENKDRRNLYISVLVIDPDGAMTVVFPNDWSAPDDAALVLVGQTLQIPDSGRDRFLLRIGEPLGVVEVLIIASVTPLRNALKALAGIARNRGLQRGQAVATEDAVTEVVDSLLDDLNQSATRGLRGIDIEPIGGGGVRGIDATQLAALSLTFEVVAT